MREPDIIKNGHAYVDCLTWIGKTYPGNVDIKREWERIFFSTYDGSVLNQLESAMKANNIMGFNIPLENPKDYI